MSRFIAYAGKPILIADLLYRSTNSIVEQARAPKEMQSATVNGDGYGFGWYAPEISDEPVVMRTVRPAWSEENMRNVAEKTVAARVLAHIRAAPAGERVVETNVHPFAYKQFLWAHNGVISEMAKLRRPIRDSLDDAAYNSIVGTSDAEFAFGIFIDALGESSADATHETMRAALIETIRRLNELAQRLRISEPSYLNFVVTDGRAIVASRYVSDNNKKAASLHYSRGSRLHCDEQKRCRFATVWDDQTADFAIVASEPLTANADDFPEVPQNHTISVSPDCSFRIEPIEL